MFKQFVAATPGKWSGRPFLAPAGVRLVRVDRRSGKRVFGSWPSDSDPKAGVIWEAFFTNGEATVYGDSPALDTISPTETKCCAPRAA